MDVENLHSGRLDNPKKEPQQEKEKPLRVLMYVNYLWLRKSEPQMVEDQESVQRNCTMVSVLMLLPR